MPHSIPFLYQREEHGTRKEKDIWDISRSQIEIEIVKVWAHARTHFSEPSQTQYTSRSMKKKQQTERKGSTASCPFYPHRFAYTIIAGLFNG